MRRLVSSRRRALPDLHVKIDDQIAEDDRVATCWRAPHRGQRASASAPCYVGISIVRLLAGKQVDCHELCAELGERDPSSIGARTVDQHDDA